jgi:hypothetical protein
MTGIVAPGIVAPGIVVLQLAIWLDTAGVPMPASLHSPPCSGTGMQIPSLQGGRTHCIVAGGYTGAQRVCPESIQDSERIKADGEVRNLSSVNITRPVSIDMQMASANVS